MRRLFCSGAHARVCHYICSITVTQELNEMKRASVQRNETENDSKTLFAFSWRNSRTFEAIKNGEEFFIHTNTRHTDMLIKLLKAHIIYSLRNDTYSTRAIWGYETPWNYGAHTEYKMLST